MAVRLQESDSDPSNDSRMRLSFDPYGITRKKLLPLQIEDPGMGEPREKVNSRDTVSMPYVSTWAGPNEWRL